MPVPRPYGGGAKSVIGLTVARAARHPSKVGFAESNPKDAR
jgi:hypothetical protein